MRSNRIALWIEKNAHRKCRIYSGEWGAYWRQSKGGYTEKEYAGVFSFKEAYESTSHCGPEKRIYYDFLTT